MKNGILDLPLFALKLGAAASRCGHVGIGLKRILYPVGYWRYPVFRHLIHRLPGNGKLRILDIGSPKLLALWLALVGGHDVVATDLQDAAIFSVWKTYCEAVARCGRALGRIAFEFQDARKLAYPDETFDLVYSISVIEHIPDSGDSSAVGEIARVLKPGGMAVIEVPYAGQARDTYVRSAVYEREYTGTPVFFQRHYDARTIRSRLLVDSRLDLVEQRFLRERIPFERFWDPLPEFVKALGYWLEWPLSIVNLRETSGAVAPGDGSQAALDVTLVLRKRP